MTVIKINAKQSELPGMDVGDLDLRTVRNLASRLYNELLKIEAEANRTDFGPDDFYCRRSTDEDGA